MAHGFAEERHLSLSGFNHRQPQLRTSDFHGNRRRSSSRPQIDPSVGRVLNRSRRCKRLNKEAIQGAIAGGVQPERRKVDGEIPAREQSEIGFDLIDLWNCHRHASEGRSCDQTSAEVS
jgi:hypothetical protein